MGVLRNTIINFSKILWGVSIRIDRCSPFFMEENKSQSPDGQEQSGGDANKQQQESSLKDTDLVKKLEFLENESKAAFKARDELKSKLKALEDAEEMKKGNYEKLITERNSELEKLKAEAEELKQFKEKFESFQTQTKNELLNELPEEHKAIAGELSLEKLKEYVKLHKTKSPGMDSTRAGGTASDFSNIDSLDGLTLTEINELIKSNPARYKVLYAKKYPKQ